MSMESTTLAPPASELAPAVPEKTDERPNYSGDADGIAAAAEEYKQRRGSEPDAFEVKADEFDKALTAKQAADQLKRHHEQVDTERDAIRKALGEDEPEIEVRDVTPQREEQRTEPQYALDADKAFRDGNAAIQQTAQAAQQLGEYRNRLLSEFQAVYPEIQNVEDIQAVASYDPDRATAAVYHLQAAEGQLGQAQQQLAAQHALAQRAVSVWAQAQDEIFAKNNPIPEAARPALAKAGIKVLRDIGLSDAEIQQSWNGGQLRSAGAQALLLKAAKYELGRQQFKNAPRPVPPKVVRPGRGVAADMVHGERAAMQRLDASGSIKDAARVLRARRGK